MRPNKIVGQVARIVDGLLHGGLGDLVEHHAVNGLAVQGVFFLEQLDKVPGNRLSLAIRVSCEVQCVCFLERLDDRLDVLFVSLDDLVFHRKVIVGVDSANLGNQVAYVPVRGEDVKILTQVLADRLRLGRRLNNDEIFGHS